MKNNSDVQNLEITLSQEFLKTYPKASVGILVLGNINIVNKYPNLNAKIELIISDLKKQFPDREMLKKHPVIESYAGYYKKFKKSYHVLGQLESVLFENRPLPSGSALISALFASELKNMLLTALHDLDAIRPPLEVDVSTGNEIYTMLRGSEQKLKQGDMYMCDQAGVISSVIYGPDNRTRVTPATSRVIFVVYAPEGVEIDRIDLHFEDIKNLIRSFSPQYNLIQQEIYPSGLKR
jgi:DNA/RNA-binding domain of Phe-tRNA-synthetase-like protein